MSRQALAISGSSTEQLANGDLPGKMTYEKRSQYFDPPCPLRHRQHTGNNCGGYLPATRAG